MNNTTKSIRYEVVEDDGAPLSPWKFTKNGKYGITQARAHVAAMRKTKGEYRKHWQTVPLHIRRVTTVTEIKVVETL